MDIANKILIAPKELNKLLLKYRSAHPFDDFVFYDLKDLQANLIGKCDDTADVFLLHNTQYSLLTINAVIDYINRGLNIDADPIVRTCYQLLNDNYLVHRDFYLSEILKSKPVLVLGYDKRNSELNRLLDLLAIKPTYQDLSGIIELEEKTILSFQSIDEEVRYVFNLMLKDDLERIDNNLKPRTKVLFCDTNKYESLIRLYSKEYGVICNFDNGVSLKSTPLGKRILKMCENGEDYINYIESKDVINEFDDELSINEIKKIIKEYDIASLNDEYSVLSVLFESRKLINGNKCIGEVIVTNKISFNPNYDYYALGASDTFIPLLKKNNGFLDDNVLKQNGLVSLDVENAEIEEKSKAFILSKLVKYISYHTIENKTLVFHTTFINNEAVPTNLNYSFSKSISLAYYSKAYYISNKFKEQTFDLSFAPQNGLPVYDNTFTGIDRGDLTHSYVSLSYSSLNQYNNCPFGYYANNVLKITEFEENFNTKKGTFAHKIFEYITKADFDDALDTAKGQLDYENYFTNKEKILLCGMLPNLRYAFNKLKEQIFNNPNFKKFYFEYGTNVEGKLIKIKVAPNTYISGKIDSIALTKNDEIFVLDYKTGSFTVADKFSIDNGLYLQLYIYVYLLSKFDEFKDKPVVGTYYQRVHTKNINIGSDDFLKEFLFEGYSYSDTYLNDLSLSPSWFKVKKDASSYDYNQVLNIVENNIIESANKIRQNKFDIKPIKLFNSKGTIKEDACEYCPFNVICYRKNTYNQARLIKDESEDD